MTQCLLVRAQDKALYLYDAQRLTGKQDACPYESNFTGYSAYRVIDEYQYQVLVEAANPFSSFNSEEYFAFSELFIILFITGYMGGLVARRLR
ncbi:hypothetical protein [Aeromonas schubertii]